MKKMMPKVVISSAVAILFAFALQAARAASVEGKPVTAAHSAAKAGWEARWDKILAKARKEGKVRVYGNPVAKAQKNFMEAFQKAYPGIALEYTGIQGREIAGKLAAERRAGLYVVDLYIGGTTTIFSSIRTFFQPIKPFVMLPDVLDGKAWLGGKLDFPDNDEELVIALSTSSNSNVAYNTNLVKADEITSFRDLTKPKFRGKIIYHDPRAAGKGLALATFWYLNPQLGLDYIKAFAANKPVLIRDHRIQAESLAHGKYAVAVGTNTTFRDFVTTPGLPLEMTPVLKEGTYNTSGSWNVALLDKPPHPNAAVVFLNWFLSREGQTIMSVTSGWGTRRLDVPTNHLHWAERIDVDAYNKGMYQDNYKESVVMEKDKVVPELKKIFAGF